MNTNDNELNKYEDDKIKVNILSGAYTTPTGSVDDLKLNSINTNIEQNIILI